MGPVRRLRHPAVLAVAVIALVSAISGFAWYAFADGGTPSRGAIAPPTPPSAHGSDAGSGATGPGPGVGSGQNSGSGPGAGSGAQSAPRPADRPNIVFILTDDLSNDLLPFMPHVQELQRQGLTFTHYFVTNSLCCPSRGSILTGGYPHTTGVLTNGGGNGGHPEFVYRNDDDHTFATSLQAAGYTTALMGKYLNGYRASTPAGGPAAAVPPGWSEWYVPGDHDGYSGFDYTLNENGRLVHYGHAPREYLTDVLADKSTEFVRRAAGGTKPFLLEVSTFAPHAPYTPAPRYADAYPGLSYPRTPAFDHGSTAADVRWLAAYPPLSSRDKATIDQSFRKRAQAARSVDDLVGNLVETLRTEQLLDNTYVVFSSDNGYHLGEHRLPVGKMTAFDTDVLVPLVVTGPGVAAGTTSDAVTGNIDLCPTFEDLGGGAPTPLVDGRSLVPLLHARPTPRWRPAILVEHRRPENAAQAGPDQESLTSKLPSYQALRFRDSLYVEYTDGGREYYDVASDPYQLRNLAAKLTPARQQGLHRALTAMAACRGTTSCRAAEKNAQALVTTARGASSSE